MVLIRNIPGETNIDLNRDDPDDHQTRFVQNERLVISLRANLAYEQELRKEMVNAFRLVLQFLEKDGHARLVPGIVAVVKDMIKKGSE